MKDLPANVKELRKRNEWSVQDLAALCGVSPRTVENWEQDRTGLSGPALVILKGLMEVDSRN